MINVYQFFGSLPGPRIVIFGAVHGNERCGAEAIRKIIQKIKNGKIRLIRGSVTFVPVANPEAYRKNIRQTEENLNRVFRRTKNPKSYEAKLANTLSVFLDDADVFLDIHSFSAKGQPFVFLDYPRTPKGNRDFIQALGFENAISGWDALYRAESPKQGYDTVRYAAERGAYNVIVECGHHNDSRSSAVAYRTILRTLRYFAVISGVVEKKKRPREVVMKKIFFKKNENDFFSKDWKHLDAVKKSQVIAYCENGKIIKAHTHGFIVLPKHWARKGEEWFYFGVEKK